MAETYIITAKLPDDWQALCGGAILDASGYELELPAGHINEQFRSVQCEVFALNGEVLGDIIFTIQNEDMTIIQNISRSFEFEKSSSDTFSISSNMIAGSIAGLLGVSLLTLIILKKKRNSINENLEDLNDSKTTPKISGPPVSGPPVQSFSNQQMASSDSQIIQQPKVMEVSVNQNPISNTQNMPPLPPTGLPEGWTYEQWAYYGQKYLDDLKKSE